MSKPRFEDTFEVPEKMAQAAIPTMKSKKPKYEDTTSVDSPVASDDKHFMETALETTHDMATVVPQGVTTWADEIEGGVRAGAKKLGGSEDPYWDLYEQEVKPIREGIARARDRSPWAAGASEVGTGILSSFIPGVGAGKLTGLGGMVGRGAVEGLGTADDKLSLEGAIHTGIGGAAGGAGSLVSGGLKKLVSADPNKIRAQVLGANTSTFQDIGIKERKEVAKELKNMGLFSKVKTKFDVKSGKWLPQEKSLESLETPARDKILTRLEDGMDSIQEQKEKLLGRHADVRIPIRYIKHKMAKAAIQFEKTAGSGMKEKAEKVLKIMDTILEDIRRSSLDPNSGEVTVAMLEEAKQRIGKDVSHYGKALTDTPDEAKIYQDAYRLINETLKDHIDDTNYAKYNSMQQKMLTAKTDVSKAIASEDAAKASAGWGGWMNKIANATLGSPDAGIGMANAAEFMQRPGLKQLTKAGVLGTAEAPFETIRQFDPSIPNAKDVPIPYAPAEEEDYSIFDAPKGYNLKDAKPAFRNQYNPVNRTYQSVQGTDMTPMELAKARLPRTTTGLLQNKEMVIAKLAQSGVDDETIHGFAQALNEDPEAVESIAAMLATQFPTLFEKSKYTMFDGKILDPQERAKAADATSKRDDMGSLHKAKIINELNKSGKWLGE